jgi:hypothetical protein
VILCSIKLKKSNQVTNKIKSTYEHTAITNKITAISNQQLNMKKQITFLSILLAFIVNFTDAQVYGGGVYMERGYRRPPPPKQYRFHQKAPAFKPTVNLSFGYGYPNLDKDYFPTEFYGAVNAFRGTDVKQTGPVSAALDFQFSRFNSIGVIGTYGKVSVPYFDYSTNNPAPMFTGDLESWSVMLNMMTYFPSYQSVSPYIRTAIGMSNRTENYTYPDGSKAVVAEGDMRDLAYQVSIGTKFNLSPNAGFFIEAGYGRYIVNGGLAFKF